MNFSIVVPAYNESKNLKLLIPQLDTTLSTLNESYEIIAADNGSFDDTQETLAILKTRFPAVVSVFEPRKGFGSAILAGLSQARGEVLGYIHADNQMEAMDIVRIYRLLKQGRLDLCKATRIDRHDGVIRWIISKVYNLLFRMLFSTDWRDINGSPKLFTRQFFQAARISSRNWFIDPEIIIKARRLKARMGEVEIRTRPRRYGMSQVHAGTILEFIRDMFRYWRGK